MFDSPNLIVLKSEGKVFGYYGFIHQILPFSCQFFFMQNGAESASEIGIDSFSLDAGKYGYENRNKDYDISGKIFIKNSDWIIQTTDSPPGCGGAVGSFLKGPEDSHPTSYTEVEEVPAIAIRTVIRKTFLFDKKGNVFSRRRGYFTSGDVVAVIEQSDIYSYVRFSHPATGKITTVWVNRKDLENPFPTH
ncbi:hypothetical protein CFter6_5197 [Collimonas fungivorans]|uniref:Uncharacterized protein n=1 Tax=Collimonas fungivorans TaxID=158899 RepID=A0A127PJ36_9BURK|nr:hypothetical protein CFter6_5197 [Collimonas fungivorans]